METTRVLSLSAFRQAVLAWRVPIVLFVAGGVAVAAAVCLLQQPVYLSTSRVFVSATGATTVQDLSQGTAFTQQIVQSYADVATNPIVLQPVIQELRLDRLPGSLASGISVRALVDTSVLEINVRDSSPTTAASIANKVTARLSAVTAVLSPTVDGKAAVTLTQIAPAIPATRPVAPNVALNLALGLLVGSMIGLGGAVLWYFFNDRIRSTEDLGRLSGRVILGHTLFNKTLAEYPLGLWSGNSNADAERYRALRTNLQFMKTSSTPQTLLVTSALPSEGKSSVASNLAIAIAQAGNRVVLIDADMRKPTLADKFGIDGNYGLSDALSSRTDVGSILQEISEVPNLEILPAGRVPPNPSELLAGERWNDLTQQLGELADVIVLDSPPLLPVTDAAVLAAQVDLVVFVVSANTSREAPVLHALATLDRATTTRIAMVLGGLKTAVDRSYYGIYGAK